MMKKDVMGFKDKFKDLSDKAKVTAGDLATKAQPHVDKAMRSATAKTNEWAEKLAETGKDVAARTGDVAGDAAEKVTKVAEGTVEKVEDATGKASDIAETTAEKVAGVAEDAAEKVSKATDNVADEKE